MMKNAETGTRGEAATLAYLQSIGYKLHARNVRIRRDEIDLVMFDPGDRVMVFVEVKARSSFDRDYTPALNITAAKKRCMRRAAQRWIDDKAFDGGWRIDIVLVVHERVVDHWIDVSPDA